MKILLMYPAREEHLDELRRACDAQFVVAGSESDALREIEDADAVLGNRYFLQSLKAARRLRWMQSNSMGVDLIVSNLAPPVTFTLTSARGVYDDDVADHALALTLSLARQIHRFAEDGKRHLWNRIALVPLAGRRATIVGWGGIGRAIARRLAAFGIETTAVRRTPGQSVEDGVPVRGVSELHAILPSTDLLLMALPLTKESRNLVGAEELSLLPPGAFVVNVGRGGTLDEEALLWALRQDRLGGASLDVFEVEPLPPESPMWDEPRLLITPHVGRSIESGPPRWEPLFVENVRRFSRGEPLLNVVDLSRGY